MKSNPVVYLVDDEPIARKTLTHLLSTVGMQVEAFSSAADFLQNVDVQANGCLLLGDEPSLAKDSRNWGPIQTKYFRGTVRSIIFPPGRLKSIEN